MRRTLLPSLVALGLATVQPAVADTDGFAAPRHSGPPVDRIASELGLNDYQATEMKRILDAAHASMEEARKASMAQVESELASVLTAEQLTQFRKLMQEGRGKPGRGGPPPGPPPS